MCSLLDRQSFVVHIVYVKYNCPLLMDSTHLKISISQENIDQLLCILKDKIQDEYNKIVNKTAQYTFSASSKQENKSKNRYFNIPCCDKIRVILPKDNHNGDYIHANFVDGYNMPRKFICTQAPLENTCYDFWFMIWTYQTQFIVMLTNIQEKGREKCFQYWSPIEGDMKEFGRFIIKTQQISYCKSSINTILQISDLVSGESRKITHFNYTKWADHSVPENTADFIDFLLMIRLLTDVNFNSTDNLNDICIMPPVVVHCSAGIGRTAVFCILDIAYTMFDKTREICLSSIAEYVRQRRFNSLYLYEHYVFCYECVLEYISLLKQYSRIV